MDVKDVDRTLNVGPQMMPFHRVFALGNLPREPDVLQVQAVGPDLSCPQCGHPSKPTGHIPSTTQQH